LFITTVAEKVCPGATVDGAEILTTVELFAGEVVAALSTFEYGESPAEL
jgi:hypothetical protein